MSHTKAPVAVDELPRDVREAIDMYIPRGIPSQSAHYYVQAEYVRLLRGRAQAERNADRWLRTVAELERALGDLAVEDRTDFVSHNCYRADILLHPGLEFPADRSSFFPHLKKGVRVASIHASFLAPAWWMGVARVYQNGHGTPRREWEWPQLAPAQKVRLVAEEVLGTLGWLRLSNEQVRQRIAEVELRDVEPGKAQVGHILFSESLEFP
jgi:hypothetical protein